LSEESQNKNIVVAASVAANTVAQAAATAAQAVSTAATIANTVTDIKLGYIQRDVGEIKQSLKEMSGVFATKIETVEMSKIQVDHESRIRTIEQNMWKGIGLFSFISSLIGIIGGWIVSHLLK